MFVRHGANEITVEDIENFLNGDGAATPAATDDEGSPATQPNTSDSSSNVEDKPTPVTETQAFAHRLREATDKVRNEERESIARSLGYESYADMLQKREAKMLEEKGLDPEDVSPVVEQIVQQRLAEDPRLRELDGYRQERVAAWAKKELAELSALTGGKISTLDDVPKDVIELWKTKGTLKGAYLELHGEALIREMQTSIASEQTRSTTGHMASPKGTPAPPSATTKRPLTAKERDVYRLFNPDVTEEQLSKMYKEN